ncbi:MAG: DUF1343 domain-containing protein [Desulfovibrionales bacterium]
MFGVALLQTLQRLYPEDFKISRPLWLTRLWGSEFLNKALEEEMTLGEIMNAVEESKTSYLSLKEKYRLYP